MLKAYAIIVLATAVILQPNPSIKNHDKVVSSILWPVIFIYSFQDYKENKEKGLTKE